MEADLEYQLLHDLTVNQVSPSKTIKNAHLNSIQCLAGNPVAKCFATGSHDHTIKIWDLQKTKEILHLADHKQEIDYKLKIRQGVWSLQYSKDYSQLLSASPDKMVQIWDSKKGSVGMRLKGHKDKIYDAKYSHSNKYVASCGIGFQILIWDLANPSKPFKTIIIPQMFAYHVEWSKSDEYLFVTTWQSKLYIFDGKTFEQLGCEGITDKGDSKCECCVSNFDLYPNQVFIATDRGTVCVYEYLKDTKKTVKKFQFTAHMDECRSVTLHETKKLLSSGGRDGSIRLWDMSKLQRPKIANNLVYHRQKVSETIFLDDWLISGSWDQNVGLWKLSDLKK